PPVGQAYVTIGKVAVAERTVADTFGVQRRARQAVVHGDVGGQRIIGTLQQAPLLAVAPLLVAGHYTARDKHADDAQDHDGQRQLDQRQATLVAWIVVVLSFHLEIPSASSRCVSATA